MTELFHHLIGYCAVYWCSFTPNADAEILQIRVRDTQAAIIKVINIPYKDLYLEGINKCN